MSRVSCMQSERTIATRNQQTLEGRPVHHPQTRKSYTREYKLEVVRFYRENNLYQTAKRFSLDTKTIRRWVADEEKIKKIKKASERVKHARKCQFPEFMVVYYKCDCSCIQSHDIGRFPTESSYMTTFFHT